MPLANNGDDLSQTEYTDSIGRNSTPASIIDRVVEPENGPWLIISEDTKEVAIILFDILTFSLYLQYFAYLWRRGHSTTNLAFVLYELNVFSSFGIVILRKYGKSLIGGCVESNLLSYLLLASQLNIIFLGDPRTTNNMIRLRHYKLATLVNLITSLSIGHIFDSGFSKRRKRYKCSMDIDQVTLISAGVSFLLKVFLEMLEVCLDPNLTAREQISRLTRWNNDDIRRIVMPVAMLGQNCLYGFLFQQPRYEGLMAGFICFFFICDQLNLVRFPG